MSPSGSDRKGGQTGRRRLRSAHQLLRQNVRRKEKDREWCISVLVTDDLRHGILRRYRDHHVNVVIHQMSLFDSTFFLQCQLPKHLAQVLSQWLIQRPSSALRDEYNVIFALPFCVA